MRGTLGIIINPAAGAGRGKPQGQRAIHLLEAAGYTLVNLSARDLQSTRAAAKQGLISGVDALIVVGGDGMVNLGTNLVATTTMPLGIVAQGTGNDIARGLGLPIRDAKASVAAIHEALTNGQRRIVDAVHVTDTVHTTMGLWYAGVLSAGFDAAVNARANLMRWPSGGARYVRALMAELMGFSGYGYRVIVDEDVREFPGTLVSVANGQAIGGGMRIAPHAAFDDGLLDVVLATALTRTELLAVFPRVYRGTHLSHPAVTVVQGRVVIVEANPEQGHHPPPAMADGEAIGPLPLRCEAVRGALHILAPPRDGH